MHGSSVERRHGLARIQKVNMLSRAYDARKSTCSREHAESQNVLASLRQEQVNMFWRAYDREDGQT